MRLTSAVSAGENHVNVFLVLIVIYSQVIQGVVGVGAQFPPVAFARPGIPGDPVEVAASSETVSRAFLDRAAICYGEVRLVASGSLP